METQGLVSSRLAEGTPARGGRRRRVYSLDPAGEAALAEAWRNLRAMAEGFEDRLGEAADDGGSGGR
jgi:DNA-binding PadR family transcriptional regulator